MKNILLVIVISLLYLPSEAQYISRSQPVPYSCPSVCPGSKIVLDIPQVQNVNSGDQLLALFSDSTSSFNSGTTTLSCSRYSLNKGSTWNNGPYMFSADVNDLYFEITIPQNLPTGNRYTIKMKSSSGYTASDLFQCDGGNYITVTAAYSTLPALPNNSAGNNQWIGHVYTWTPTTGQLLSTTNLVNQQNFFDLANYVGYFKMNNLSFDINYNTASGGTCPGIPGTLNDGTSIPCSEGLSSDFSIRLLNHYNFPAGTYKFEIQGDDGIRFSIDGGSTWLLSSFFEQKYADSYQSTTVNNPNGICLSGPTDLVLEFFQRNVDTHLTFTATLLSSTSVGDAGNQTTCGGSNATFRLNTTSEGASYQWYYSTNGGTGFNPVPNSAPFSGADSSVLSITPAQSSYNNYLFRCLVTGLCSTPINTPVDTLFIGGNGAPAKITSDKGNICSGDSAKLCAPENCMAYAWNTGATSQCITVYNGISYYATVTYSTGCTASTDYYAINVYPVPSVPITLRGDTLSSHSAVAYQWLLNGTVIEGATNSQYIVKEPGDYSVVITDNNGCKTRSTDIPVGTAGVGAQELTERTGFEIYPNPVTENTLTLYIYNQSYFNKTLYLYNTEGQLMNRWTVNNPKTELSLSAIVAGVYFLKYENEVSKFIKE